MNAQAQQLFVLPACITIHCQVLLPQGDLRLTKHAVLACAPLVKHVCDATEAGLGKKVWWLLVFCAHNPASSPARLWWLGHGNQAAVARLTAARRTTGNLLFVVPGGRLRRRAAPSESRHAGPPGQDQSRHPVSVGKSGCAGWGQGEEVAVAGRVMARRVMGKLAFVRLEDDSGSVQLYVDRATLEAAQPGGFRRGRPFTRCQAHADLASKSAPFSPAE